MDWLADLCELETLKRSYQFLTCLVLQWVDVKVPFTTFTPVVRGRTVSSRSINPSSVFSVQVMLSKYEYDGQLNPNFTEGPFGLEFGSIGAYK